MSDSNKTITTAVALPAGSVTKATSIEVLAMMPGACVIKAGEERVALGFPEDIVKAWLKHGAKPTAWLLPDIRSKHGIVQWALEFPLYEALFVRGLFARGAKIPVIVERQVWNDVLDYLRLTLLGLTEREMLEQAVDPERAAQLAKESDFVALKRVDGTTAAITDFIEPVFFDDAGTAVCGALTIERHGQNKYTFTSKDDRLEGFVLDVPADQPPTYAPSLRAPTTPVSSQPFEVITLGASNGFDINHPASNFVVQASGHFMLIDCGPHIRRMLEASGLAMHQLSALVLTHAHEDHAVGLSALLDLRQRLTLFISRENAEIMRRKLAILNPDVDHPASLLDDVFDIVYIEPHKTFAFANMVLRFHYTFHSIPCTGLEISVEAHGEVRRALIVGDSDSRAHVEAARKARVFSDQRFAELIALYAWRGDLIIADAGEGAIHGSVIDYADSPSPVVYMHTSKLPDDAAGKYTLAKAGYRYTLLAESPAPTGVERGLALQTLSDALGVSDLQHLHVLLDTSIAQNLNPGSVVVRQGDDTRDLYVVLAGELEVLVRGHEGKAQRVAKVVSGELFGERAAVNGASRAASVAAITSARVLKISGDAFARYAERHDLVSTLPALWEKRRAMEQVTLLSQASGALIHQLAAVASQKSITPGSTLIREKSSSNTVFILLAGRVQVFKGGEPLLVNGTPVIVQPGSLIGETAPFLNAHRNASVVTLDECVVLAIAGADFRRIVERSPQLFCQISRTVKSRRAA